MDLSHFEVEFLPWVMQNLERREDALCKRDDADIQSELVTDHVLLGQVRKVQLKSRS